MMQRHRLQLAALVLLLPLLVLGGIVAKNQRDIASAKTWRVKITGYDPRDLLFGHYLNFRFDWGASRNDTCSAGQSCCLCLNAQNGSTTPIASLKTCEAATQCVSRVPVPDPTRNNDAFNPEGAQRYFIPESAANQLNTLLANRQFNLQVDVKITPSGQHILGDLYIDTVEWRDYLRQHPEAGQEHSVQHHDHAWRMKITDARLYGAYLVFRLNWGAPLTRSACPSANACCALCLSEQAGSSAPAIRYKACGVEDKCLESLTLHDTKILNHTDIGFDPDGAQRYPMPPQEAADLAPLLAGPPKDMSIDIKTAGWGGPPVFVDLYIDGMEWRDWQRQHASPHP
jgi:uncharacterized membrane-anchored protein